MDMTFLEQFNSAPHIRLSSAPFDIKPGTILAASLNGLTMSAAYPFVRWLDKTNGRFEIILLNSLDEEVPSSGSFITDDGYSRNWFVNEVPQVVDISGTPTGPHFIEAVKKILSF